MNKKMREIMSQIQAKTAEAKSFMSGENKDVAKANEILDQIEALKSEYETEKRIYEMEKESNTPDQETLETEKSNKTEIDAIAKFARDARAGFPKSMNEGTNSDGGYTVPEEISTRIEKYRDAKKSLLSLVRVEKVNTNRGARTFKARANQTGFSKVGEGSAIGSKATPTFSRLTYEIDKYAGYFPVTNELLADSDASLVNTLTEWIGDESRVTANKLILGVINTVSPTNLANLDGIKKAFNVTLGSAFKSTSKIVTNDDGLQYLDTLKDSQNRYQLAPNPSNPMALVLSAGAVSIPIEVVPNGDLASPEVYALSTDTSVDATKTYYTRTGSGTSANPYIYTEVASPTGNPSTSSYYEMTGHNIPFILGDLYEGVVYWDRQQRNILVSNTAVVGSGNDQINAFEDDYTIYRSIEREDVTLRDSQALVNGYIFVSGN